MKQQQQLQQQPEKMKCPSSARQCKERTSSMSSKEIVFDNTNPEAFMKQMRHQALSKSTTLAELEDGTIMTMNRLLKVCHGLIQINQEIWQRCRPFCCKVIPSDHPATTTARTHKSVGTSTNDKFIFYRVRHLNVRAHYGVPSFSPSNMEGNELILKSDPHVMKLAFDIPTSLPAPLASLVPTPKPDPENFMPNYGQVFQQSMLLMDELVYTFLLGFKKFLEQQLTALGHVDVWLFQENDSRPFLQDQFGGGGGVTLPSNDDPTWHYLFANSPSAASICYHKCSRCGKRFEFHTKNARDDWITCPTSDPQSGCFPMQNQKEIVLLRCDFPGSIQFDFSIDTAKDRTRLIHFLKFLGHDSSPTATPDTHQETGKTTSCTRPTDAPITP